MNSQLHKKQLKTNCSALFDAKRTFASLFVCQILVMLASHIAPKLKKLETNQSITDHKNVLLLEINNKQNSDETHFHFSRRKNKKHPNVPALR